MGTKKLQILGELGEKIYKQDEEPVDAPEGALWIDTDAEASAGGGSGGGSKEWKKVAAIKITNCQHHISVTEDENGNPLSFDEAIVIVCTCKPSTYYHDCTYTIAPYNGWVEDFSQYGFYDFVQTSSMRIAVVKFNLLGGGFLETHVAPTATPSGSLYSNDILGSQVMPTSWDKGASGSLYAITIPKDINSDIVFLNEDGKMCGITIGPNSSSQEFDQYSTFEVWVR